MIIVYLLKRLKPVVYFGGFLHIGGYVTISSQISDTTTGSAQVIAPNGFGPRALPETAIPNKTSAQRRRWAFQAKTNPVVSSNIIRVGDLVEPLDPHLPAWNQLRRLSVTLVPVARDEIRIDRQRLSRLITNYESNSPGIDWIGPSIITVKFRHPESRDVRSGFTSSGASSPANLGDAPMHRDETVHRDDVATSGTLRGDLASSPGGRLPSPSASFSPARPDSSAAFAASAQYGVRPAAAAFSAAGAMPTEASATERAVTSILNLIHRRDRKLANHYECSVVPYHRGLHDLDRGVSFSSAVFLDPVGPGRRRVEVRGYRGGQTVAAVVEVELVPHPMVVVPRKSLRRGHRLNRSDLILEPLPQERWAESYSDSIDEFIGMEAAGPLRALTPIRTDQIRSPVLVRRNDAVTVRVNSGRFRVTTEARARSDGSKGELIEVESISPKRQLFARVVATGLVEITSRPTSIPE